MSARSVGVRYTRQVRLAEVGEEGQRRLAEATVRPRCCGVAGEIEARYLVAAGVGALGDADLAVAGGAGEGTPQPFAELDPGAREFALGAAAALASLREVWRVG